MVNKKVKVTNMGNTNTGISLPKSTAPVQRFTGSKPGSEAELPVQNPVSNVTPATNKNSPTFRAVNNDDGVQGDLFNGQKPNLPTVLPVEPPADNRSADTAVSSNASGLLIKGTSPGVKADLPVLTPGGSAFTMVEALSSGSTPAYDPNVDYQALINEAVKNGDYESAAQYEQLRNQKIKDLNASGTNKWGVEETDLYSQYLPGAGSSSNTSSGVKENLPVLTPGGGEFTMVEALSPDSASSATYDPDIDYQALINEAVKNGDYESAAQYEQLRNQKIKDLNASGTNKWGVEETDLYSQYLPGAGSSSGAGSGAAGGNVAKPGDSAQLPVETPVNKPTPSGASGEYDDTYIKELISSLGGSAGETSSGTKYGDEYVQKLLDSLGISTGATTPEGSGSTDPLSGVLGQILSKYNKTPSGSQAADLSDLASKGTMDRIEHLSTDKLTGLLDELKAAGQQQANGQIDYATQQAITALERTQQDAQSQYREQAGSISRDERQAMDNAALYAELRGDRGGIGQEQYSSIQNTAAQGRLAVQQAQTKLATDTARQIEDLRAQGEFEKADKALELTQSYLSKLISIEQWAQENNLTVDQINAQLQQWENDYRMALKQLEISTDQWEREFGFSQDQFATSLDQWAKEYQFNKEQADISNSQWQQQFNAALQQWANEFAFDKEQADIGNSQWQKEFDASKNQSTSGSSQISNSNDSNIYQALQSVGAKDYGTAYEILRNAGYSTTDANRYAQYFSDTWVKDPSNQVVGSSPKYENAISMAQGMTKDEADVFLGALVANGSITQAEAEHIYDNVLTFITVDKSSDKYQPVTKT